VLWQEAPRLFGLDARDEKYIMRIEDDGKTRVIFGDGHVGARPPTGIENITATYRSGIGLPGMVTADHLTLLQTRPLGIRSVTNPLPASGAAEPERRDNARTNAPLTVLTLDRIVSLRDFEDFARAFAGIGKAQAVPIWKEETRLVHITIAAAASADSTSALATNVVEPTSQLFTNLVAAIKASSDPSQQFLVDTYRPLYFNVTARVLVNPRYKLNEVMDAVETALKSAFSFQQRGFGQPVTAAEVLTVIQGVPGVIACDLRQLYRYEENVPPPEPQVEITNDLLEAQQARLEGDTIQLAELLLINPVGIRLEEMKS
jgi:predicted phage baseplate assembly protein